MYIKKLIYKIKLHQQDMLYMYKGLFTYIYDYKFLQLSLMIIVISVVFSMTKSFILISFLVLLFFILVLLNKSKFLTLIFLLSSILLFNNFLGLQQTEIIKNYWLGSIGSQKVSFEGMVVSPRKERMDSNQYKLQVLKINGEKIQKSKLEAYINIDKEEKVLMYDLCYFTGKVSEYKGELYINSARDINCKDQEELALGKSLLKKINIFSEDIEESMERDYHEPYSSLLIGIILGKKRLFEKEFSNAIIVSGTSHITAASGFNVSIISVGIEKSLSFINKKSRILITIIFVWFYAILSGLSGSIVRASVVYLITNFAIFIGRESRQLVNLIYAVAIIYLIDINSINDMGLILSVSATLGILIIKPLIERKIKVLKSMDTLSTTLACTLSTAPIIIFSFGKLNFNGLFTSILILPFIEYIFYLGIFQLVISSINIQPLILISDYCVTLNSFILKFYTTVVQIFSNFNGLNFNIETRYNTIFLVLIMILLTIAIPSFILEKSKNNLKYYFKKA